MFGSVPLTAVSANAHSEPDMVTVEIGARSPWSVSKPESTEHAANGLNPRPGRRPAILSGSSPRPSPQRSPWRCARRTVDEGRSADGTSRVREEHADLL